MCFSRSNMIRGLCAVVLVFPPPTSNMERRTRQARTLPNMSGTSNGPGRRYIAKGRLFDEAFGSFSLIPLQLAAVSRRLKTFFKPLQFESYEPTATDITKHWRGPGDALNGQLPCTINSNLGHCKQFNNSPVICNLQLFSEDCNLHGSCHRLLSSS